MSGKSIIRAGAIINVSVVDRKFTYNGKRYYLEYHNYHGATVYLDKYLRVICDNVPKIILRRIEKYLKRTRKPFSEMRKMDDEYEKWLKED